jgi:tRNA(adenine34) deaminase
MTSPEEKFMRLSLKLADKAAELGEVPVGALIVQGPLDAKRPKVLARAHNLTESRQDPAGHAEVLALRQAAKKLKRWRLNDCTLIVTLEPCAMCAGLSVWSRLSRIVFGAYDPKAGACGSVLQVADHHKLNHRIPLTGGILAEECGAVLKTFFKTHRARAKAAGPRYRGKNENS